MNRIVTRLEEGGQLVIPAEYCKTQGITAGDDLLLVLEGHSLRVMNPREGIRRAQALVRSYVPEGASYPTN